METMNKDNLLEQIKHYNEQYRKGVPEISDAEYDAKIELLKQLDPENEWFQHSEPSPVSNSRKVKLPIPMKSLNKIKNLSDLIKWAKSLGLSNTESLVLMPKFDGLSLLVNESNNKAYSRGGSENEGQDCSAHYNASPQIHQPAITPFLYTFGEFIISWKDWDKYFKGQKSIYTGDIFKSPRNTAAGLLNRDEPCDYLNHVSFFRYGTDTISLQDYNTFGELIHDLCEIYKQKHLYVKAKLSDISEDKLAKLFADWSKIYPCDGIVVYIDDLNLWDKIGRHQTTGNPLYAIAYKHPDFTESFETTVKGITWKVSKSGALKPVVNIEMVDTGDCNMENPTGYNAGWINDHEIAEGAQILVTRSGGVIPKILSTITPASQNAQENMWDDLCECPHCGAPTKWNENHIELCCTNPNCPGIKLAKITFFYLTCGAENVGEETFAKIFNAGFTSISSILNITFDELIQIDGFGMSIANTILENNKRILQGVDMPTLMQASDCFSGIGKIKAQKILDGMDDQTLEAFYNKWYVYPSIGTENFNKLPKTQQAFIMGVAPFYKFLSETNVPVLKPTNKTVNTAGPCAGMSICVSGFRDVALDNYIQSNGGTIVSGVSKKTSLLIVKETTSTSSKSSKAQSLGIPIISIDEFCTKYGYCK